MQPRGQSNASYINKPPDWIVKIQGGNELCSSLSRGGVGAFLPHTWYIFLKDNLDVTIVFTFFRAIFGILFSGRVQKSFPYIFSYDWTNMGKIKWNKKCVSCLFIFHMHVQFEVSTSNWLTWLDEAETCDDTPCYTHWLQAWCYFHSWSWTCFCSWNYPWTCSCYWSYSSHIHRKGRQTN